MKPRAEVVKLIAEQLGGPVHVGINNNRTPISGREKGYQWHYGVQELRELLDFIYGEPPQSDDERLQGKAV